MQWRKHVRIKYGGRVGVGSQRGGGEEEPAGEDQEPQEQDENQPRQVQLRVVQLQQSNGSAVSYVVQPQIFAGTASLRGGNLLACQNNNSNVNSGSCIAVDMLCCGRRKEGGRGDVTDISASPGRQVSVNQLRPKDPPSMVVQPDFRKISGITTEIFRQIETIENDHDASTIAALEAVDKHGEMVVRIIEPRQMGRHASEAAKKYLAMQDPKHPIHFVEIVKRPGQTLGLYIREGNGVDRIDGVFISRIAVETAVYNSGCLKVGDEILAVNLVDVTHMSLDDVVIIMSIPRRLLLAIRHGPHQLMSHNRQNEHKAPPVVVIKKDINEDETDHVTSNHIGSRRRGDGREMLPSRSKLGLSGLGSSQDIGASNGDLYYNSRPESHLGWTYQPPPPPVITQQPKPASAQHFQPYERGYPKTLESLAEKVHSFYPSSMPNGSRRMSGPGMSGTLGRISSGQSAAAHYASAYAQHPVTGRMMPRSGSDQHLPRIDYASITTPARHTLLRSSLKTGSSALRYGSRYGQNDLLSGSMSTQRQGQFGTLTRRHRPSLDYASDTEATCSSSPRSAYYYYRNNMTNPAQSSVSHLATLSRSQIGQSTGRIPSSPSIFTSDEYRAWLSRTPSTSALYEQIRPSSHRPPRYTYSAENIHAAVNAADYGGYGTYRQMSSTLDRLSHRSASAQQVNLANLRASTAISSSSSHRAAAAAAVAAAAAAARVERPSSAASNVRSALVSASKSGTLGSVSRASAAASAASIRAGRMRNLLDLEAAARAAMPTAANPLRALEQRLLDINPAEFLKYKLEKPTTVGTPSSTSSLLSSLADGTPPPTHGGGDFTHGVSGLLWVHLLAGRGLRATNTASAATTPSTPSGQSSLVNCGLRDLYCVLECDRVHKARTVVRTGDLMFDWDENFELDLVGNRQLDLLVYSWDPQYRHKLCYKGSVHLASLLRESPLHQLAVKVEPRGTIYLRLKFTDAQQTFRRRGLPIISLATRVAPLFGIDLDTVVTRESKTGGVPGGVSTALAMGGTGVPSVPIIVWRCVEEVERRGLDIIGLYRLCGSATKKRILREAFERNARSVDLSADNVPDINVVTGVLKDYLRELPEPLFTKCLYQMMVDALGVCLPDDPQGNAKLMFSILDCLPTVNKCTLIYLLDHLAMVISQCNKMSPSSLAVCFGPVLMLHSDDTSTPLDFQQPIAVLKYLLEIWPIKSVRKISSLGSTLPRATPSSHGQQQQQQQQQLNSSGNGTNNQTSSTSNSSLSISGSSSSLSQQPQVSSASQILHQHLQQQQQQQSMQSTQSTLQRTTQQSSMQLQTQQQPPLTQPRQSPLQIQTSQPGQQQQQSQLSGTLPRTGLPWQQQPSHHPPLHQVSTSSSLQMQQQTTSAGTITSVHQQPPTTSITSRPPPPPPIKPRQQQVIVSSPGSPSSEDSPSYQESVKSNNRVQQPHQQQQQSQQQPPATSAATSSPGGVTFATCSKPIFATVKPAGNPIFATTKPRAQSQSQPQAQAHPTNPFLSAMNGNGTSNHYSGNGHNFFAQSNGTVDQVTPTSSVDTEDGATGAPEEGVDGDAEASDDDQVRRANLSKP